MEPCAKYTCWMSDKGHLVYNQCRRFDDAEPDKWYDSIDCMVYWEDWRGLKWRLANFKEEFELQLQALDRYNHTEGPKLPVLFSRKYSLIHEARGGKTMRGNHSQRETKNG